MSIAKLTTSRWFKFIDGLVLAATALSLFVVKPPLAGATGGPATIRQEINITDAYYYAPSGSYATSSEMVAVTDNSYTSPAYYFEAVASTTSGTNASVYLVNATSSAVVATLTINGGNTYQRYRSSAFLPNASSTVEYKVVLGNESVGKGILASRIVILQNATIAKTETQIEIGSATTTANNTTTLPLQNPKYWSYTSANWDASPSFYVEASVRNRPAASSTTYATAGTFNYKASTGVSYTIVDAWGGGGSGFDGSNSGGGAGGGGGAFASSTLSLDPGTTYSMTVGAGGTGSAADGADTTFNTTTVVADAGGGGKDAATTGGIAGSTANSTGQVKFAGGTGGIGNGGDDGGGGGGGAGGPHGKGGNGADASATAGGGGGEGDGGANGSGTTGGTGGPGGDGGNGGNGGVCTNGGSSSVGGGGAGGADQAGTACTAGAPGGGGGGAETTGPWNGAAGQIKLTEYIGTTGVALQEDDGNFGTWTTVSQFVVALKNATSTERIRSNAFSPTNGRHYRLVASTTNSTASYDIYNAKIIVTQASNAGGIQVTDSYSETNFASATHNLCSSGCIQVVGQSFAAAASTLDSAKFYIRKVGAPTGNATVKIYAHSGTFGVDSISTGVALATSDNFNVSTLSTSFALATFTFSGANRISLSATNYIVTLEYAGGDASNYVNVAYDTSSPTHAGNQCTMGAAGSCTSSSSSFDTVFYVNSDYGAAIANPTLLEPQYLLAPFKYSSTTPNTYYFDASDAGPTDPNSNWTNDANAFDGNTATAATAAANGSVSTNYLFGEGTNAPTSGDTFSQVRARAWCTTSATRCNPAVYTDGLAELLGTPVGGNGTFGPYTTLSTPSGGWTWAKVAALETKLYFTNNPDGAGGTAARAEVEVSSYPTGPQTFLTTFDPSEWSGVANTYLFQTDAADNSTSVSTLIDETGATTYATNTSPDNSATSTVTCIPSTTTTWDTKATTNNNDIYGVRVLVAVAIGGAGGTSVCGGGGGGDTNGPTQVYIIDAQAIIQDATIQVIQ